MNYEDDYISFKTMVNIFNDLSIFKWSYLFIYFIGFFCIAFYEFSSIYKGILPFTQSMISQKDSVKALNDFVMLYYVVMTTSMLIKYYVVGLSHDIIRNFKKAARNDAGKQKLDRSISDEEARRQIFLYAIFLICVNIFWFWAFGLASFGNSSMARSFFDGSLFTYGFLMVSFFLNLFIFLFAIILLELKKHAVFLR